MCVEHTHRHQLHASCGCTTASTHYSSYIALCSLCRGQQSESLRKPIAVLYPYRQNYPLLFEKVVGLKTTWYNRCSDYSS